MDYSSNTNSQLGDYLRPSLKNSLFSRRNDVSLQSVRLDTYPNPLYGMSKQEILDLPASDYLHLIQIPYRSINETDEFCFNVSQIFNDLIIQDSRRAYQMLMSLPDEDVKSRIIDGLLLVYKKDRIKTSILKYMTAGEKCNFTQEFINTVTYIRSSVKRERTKAKARAKAKAKANAESDTSASVSESGSSGSSLLLKYLDTLSCIPKVNSIPILLSKSQFHQLFGPIPKPSYGNFFSYLVNINIKPKDMKLLNPLKRSLIYGSNLEKFIVKTGVLHAKWHHTQYHPLDHMHKRKMMNFYSLHELAQYAKYGIGKEDIIESNLYLNLMVEKFESNCEDRIRRRDNSTTRLQEEVAEIILVLLNHIITFKGPTHCIKVLKYMMENDLDVSFEHLLSIVTVLRKQNYLQEALLVVNHIQLDDLSRANKLTLINEIILLIQQRYPGQPKVLVGYLVAFFKDGATTLDRLQILKLIYGKDFDRLSTIQLANIDSKISQIPIQMTSTALKSIYETVLSLQKDENLSKNIKSLYSLYIEYLQLATNISGDDQIITLFIKSLLKENPSSDMKMSTNIDNYLTAKSIVEDFHEKIAEKLSRNQHSVYLYDLLIYSALTVHNDYPFAAKMIKFARTIGLPFSFNQIYPFIKFHYSRNEFKQAELWYNELVKNGVQTTSSPSQEIFKIARKLNWEVSGFVYRKNGILKNYQKREEYKKVDQDPFKFLGKKEIEDEITDELIGINSEPHASVKSQEESNDINLKEELSSLLYNIKHLKQEMSNLATKNKKKLTKK